MFAQTVLYLLIILQIFGASSENPEVEIPQGKLSGDTRTNRDGGTYYAFKNIPFGQPPTGELRFKAPLPADGWNGTRDATGEVPECSSEEDCLYLNIYTAGLPSENVTDLPVMVWIYGGGFVDGGASEKVWGAKFLLTRNITLVAINYRTGILGFLSLDDPDLGVTGNAGLKDQNLALQWVQDNIEYFGGDPDNVLIFGQSAGSMSTHYHIVSPTSKGLFHKAILESGVSISETVHPAMRNNAIVLAEYMGIQTSNYTEMVASLQSANLTELQEAQTALISEYGHYFTKPVVEIASSEPTFLEELPIDILKSGNFNQVPFIIGFNSAEESGTTSISNFTEYIPGDIAVGANSTEIETIAESIEAFYFGDNDTDTSAQSVSLATDFYFGYPTFRATSIQSNTSSYPIYYYLFSAVTELNGSSSNKTGASHGDELNYLFYSASIPDIEEGSIEDIDIERMVTLWTNFALYSNPTPDDSQGFTWEPATVDEFYYLQIQTNESVLSVNPKEANFAFWREIYQEYYPGGI